MYINIVFQNFHNFQKKKSEEELHDNHALIDKYIKRPSHLINMSLLEFAKKINIYGTKYTNARIENIVIISPNIHLMDENSEEYYRQQCILQIPFRQSFHELYKSHGNSDDDTWCSYFDSHELLPVQTDLVLDQIEEFGNIRGSRSGSTS